MYQINTFSVDGKKRTVASVQNVDAPNIQTAIENAAELFPETLTRCYPLVTMEDPETIVTFGKWALGCYENWERGNENAALNPIRRTREEREDLRSIAMIAVLETLQKSPAAPMYTVHNAAWDAIALNQYHYNRISERVYNPDFLFCNMVPRYPRPTFPPLDRLMDRAIEIADLTDNQRAIFTMFYNERLTPSEIARETGKGETETARRKVYNALYRSYYHVLQAAVQLDCEGIFARAGITSDDIAETLEKLKRRGNMNK